MSQRSYRKAAFFKLHPRCCFCGGDTPATTEDHVPARSIFNERHWPEGYNFPACDRCNQLTRRDENVVAFLCRIRSANDGKQTDGQLAEMRRCMAAMKYAYPEAYRALKVSPNDARRFLKENDIPRPPNTLLTDIPILSIGRPEFVGPLKNFGIKLFCALDYKHNNRIVPANGTIAIRFLTNVQIDNGALTDKAISFLPGRPQLVRSKNELQDQFNYIYGVSTEKTASAYICSFRQSFVLMGIVSTTGLSKDFDEDPEMGAFKGSPFSLTGATPSA